MQSPPFQETTQSWIRRRAPAWAEQEVLDLIACWGDESVMAELRSKKRNANTYAKVSRAMTERGYSRDTEQCRTKIKELRQAYQKAREANGCSESQPHTCRFSLELHAIMGGDDTTTPPLYMDTCKGGVAWSKEDEFLEDEEEEEEDSAQAASGESVFSSSQELFLTLEPIASPYSQSMLPDHDPGEGTSGLAHVTSIVKSVSFLVHVACAKQGVIERQSPCSQFRCLAPICNSSEPRLQGKLCSTLG
ncbi:Zinc finger and SCAN domain-containing protein 29 [Chelonia mydas]|uniref:Zinc finger and SCAN domain-containing protein 29 n=1 Tax=Chelonia mydas TaxID=8469 RepID=M7BBH8_CHEMY|nr:Zinc finger and SCAN domain-containing protein 29 [Chelonia mydas]